MIGSTKYKSINTSVVIAIALNKILNNGTQKATLPDLILAFDFLIAKKILATSIDIVKIINIYKDAVCVLEHSKSQLIKVIELREYSKKLTGSIAIINIIVKIVSILLFFILSIFFVYC